MKRSPVVIVVIAALAVVGGLGLASVLDAPAEEAGPADPEPQRVETAEVRPTDASSTLRFAGTVRSARRARVGFSVAGRLVDRPVVVGDRVRAGQRLGRLESDELTNAASAAEAALGEARARAEQAERESRRVARLAEAKAATDEELERARSAVETATAAVRRAEANLDEARRRAGEAVLTAPWAATVTEVMANPGEYLSAGDRVVELSGDGRPEIEIRVPESFLAELAAGDTVDVELHFSARASGAAAGRALTGTVRSVGGAAGGRGRLFPVLVDLPADAGVAPGQAAEVLVRRSSGAGLSVPLTAILNPGGSRPVVFRVDPAGGGDGDDGEMRAVEVPVVVEELAGERVAVSAAGTATASGPGLAAGDRVVVAGHLGLIDGDPVLPMADQAAPVPTTPTGGAR